MESLSRAGAGVHLSATKEVADIKVTVLVRDMTLEDLRARLTEVLHLSWRTDVRPNSNETSYLLYRSSKDVAEESELVARGERSLRSIDEAIGALANSPEERAKLFASRGALAQTFADPGGVAGLSVIAQLPAEVRDSILDGSSMQFSAASPPAGIAGAIDQAATRQLQTASAGTPYADVFTIGPSITVGRYGEGADSSVQISFNASTEKYSGSTGVFLRGTDSGEAYPDSYPVHSGSAYDVTRKHMTISAELAAGSLDDLLEKVADSLHINIISESYRQYLPRSSASGPSRYPVSVPAGDTTIEQVFDAVAAPSTWRKRGTAYLIQRPLWWMDRRCEVSDVQLQHVEAIVSKPRLYLEDIADLGKTLDEYQWRVVMSVSMPVGSYLDKWQELARFYGNLAPRLRSYLLEPAGLDLFDLREGDQRRLAS